MTNLPSELHDIVEQSGDAPRRVVDPRTQRVDVTELVKARIDGNQISSLVKDIVKNVVHPFDGPKVLFIRYSFGGETRAISVDDQSNLTLGK